MIIENTTDILNSILKEDGSMPSFFPVYICLFSNNALISKAIKKVTNSPFSHVGISFDLSLNTIYTFNLRGFDIEGFKENNLYNPEATFSLYSCMIDEDKLYSFKNSLEEMYKNKKNYSYNWLGIIALGLTNQRFSIKNNNSYFCSEFVSLVIENLCGYKVFNKPNEYITPNDFTKIKKFKFLYRGKVKNYNPDKIKK